MEKIVKFFLVLVFMSVALFADSASYMKQLEQYDTQMKSASKSEKQRIFHGIQSIYIQAKIAGDNSLKAESLTRLVKNANELNIDASKYESELRILQKNKPMDAKKEEQISSRKPVETPSLNQEEAETTRSIASSREEEKSPTLYKGKNILKGATSEKDVIVFTFSHAVDTKKVRILGLNNGSAGYKKIIDVPAILLGKTPSARPIAPCEAIHINQYNSDTIRIVLDAKKPFDIYASTIGDKLFLAFSKNTAVSSTPTPIAKEPKSAPSTTPSEQPVVPIPTLSKVNDNDAKLSTKTKHSRTIVIDAGHGGKDSGAVGYKNRSEKHLVLAVALELGKVLQARGHKVFYTRKKDEFINLRDRTKVANDKNADLFISLHANAAPSESKKSSMKGLETFFLSPDRSERSKSVAALENQSDMEEMAFYSKETFLNVLNREKIVLSNKAAIDIQSNMLKSARKKYSVDDGGVREAPFWVLVGATMPSVLVEVGYITHPDESEKMFSSEYQKLLVQGMSDGIERYFINNP